MGSELQILGYSEWYNTHSSPLPHSLMTKKLFSNFMFSVIILGSSLVLAPQQAEASSARYRPYSTKYLRLLGNVYKRRWGFIDPSHLEQRGSRQRTTISIRNRPSIRGIQKDANVRLNTIGSKRTDAGAKRVRIRR